MRVLHPQSGDHDERLWTCAAVARDDHAWSVARRSGLTATLSLRSATAADRGCRQLWSRTPDSVARQSNLEMPLAVNTMFARRIATTAAVTPGLLGRSK